MHKIIKKIIALVFLSWSFTVCQMTSRVPNNVYGTVSLVIAQPQGEFSNNVNRNGLGVNLDGGWYIFNGPVAIGGSVIFAQYGSLSRDIPFSYFSSAITLRETTQSGIVLINPYVRPTIKIGTFNLFLKAFGGYQILTTDTKIQNDDQINQNSNSDDDQPEYIAKSTIYEDGAFNYGYGLGVRFALFPGKIKADGTMSSPTIINLEFKWSNGGEARYLNAGEDGSIVFSDPADGPVTTTFFPKKSETDLFCISIGVGF